MGICISSECAKSATAKLVLYDGRLQEFPYPVKVAYVLQENPAVFICNSDEMDFDDVVSPINDDEELLPGRLYFALPLTRLRQRLPAKEMAALAVKASLALTKSGGGKCGCRRKRSLLFSTENGKNPPPAYEKVGRGPPSRSSSGGRRRRMYSAMLSVIPE